MATPRALGAILFNARSKAGALLQSWPLRRVCRTDADGPGQAATLRCFSRTERLVVTKAAVTRAIEKAAILERAPLLASAAATIMLRKP